MIGDYAQPKTRLPGAGGAPEIATGCERGRRDRAALAARRSSQRLDFLHRTARPRRTPDAVITDLGVLERDAGDGELMLTALHGETTVEEAVEATGWELRAGRAAAHAGADGRGAQDPARAARALASSAGSQPPTRLPARASAAALPMTWSRPGPTPTRLIGTPVESEIAAR